MIAIKNMLAAIILTSAAMGFFRGAQKIACTHIFQAKAFGVFTRRLHTRQPAFTIPAAACGEILWRKGFEVQTLRSNRVFKLKMEKNIVNEPLSSP